MRLNLLFYTLLFTALFACKHEPQNPAVNPTQGDPSLPNCHLLRSSYKDNPAMEYVFEYDSFGRLVKRLELWNGALRVWHVLRYDDNSRLQAREQWTAYTGSPVKMVYYDTLLYNAEGQVAERRVLDPENNFAPKFIYDYSYDADGYPVKSRTYYVPSNTYFFSYEYTWTDGNLTRKTDYAGDFGALRHEWFYEYAPFINPERLCTVFPENPEYRSRNVVKTMSAKDYTGLLDLICNPCKHSYTPNPYAVPVRIKYGWGDELELEWDCE